MPHAKAPGVGGFSFLLCEDGGRLSLRAQHHPQYGLVCADWMTPEMQRRIRGGRKQLLARAVGLKSPGWKVLDATGGLGRDAWTLAALGAEVTLCERNPTALRLLADARQRAADARPDIAARLWLHAGDARTLEGRWDAVHLDPMYPHAGRTALPSKELQVLRELCGDDEDAGALLDWALDHAPRVAVKRPLVAPALTSRPPRQCLRSTQVRYDLYP